jgi:hypothetical protein
MIKSLSISLFILVMFVACNKKTVQVSGNNINTVTEQNVEEKPKPTITKGEQINKVQTIKIDPQQVEKLKQAQQNNATPNNNTVPGTNNPVKLTPENNKATKP